MRSFFKNVITQKQYGNHALLGRLVQVGPYNLRVESHISDGGFAAIFKVKDVATGRAYALKHMRMMGDKEAIADCMTEINALKALRQVPSVITLRAAAFTGAKGSEQEAYLVLDLCTVNLAEYILSQEKAMSTATIIEIFSCICQAVAAMHQQSPPLAHRDLKAENVLQHREGGWVLCDFGSVTDKPSLFDSSDQMMMGEEMIRKYTTPAYRAPEMWDLYSRERIDTKADIWALGCLLYFLMYGKLAFQAEAKLQILNGDIIIPPSRPPPLVELLRKLLVVSPQRRPDIIHVVRRLQEVAEMLNVDPALLVPSTPVPSTSGSFRERHQASGASPAALDRASSSTRPSASLAGSASAPSQSSPVPSEPHLSANSLEPQPPSTAVSSQRADVAHIPSARDSPQGPQEGFADFEQAFASAPAPPASAPPPTVSTPPAPAPAEKAPQKAEGRSSQSQSSLSPPRSRAPLYPTVGPRVSPHESPTRRPLQQAGRDRLPQGGRTPGRADSAESRLQAVQTQLGEALSQNETLKALLKTQQTTIRRLQAENQSHVLQLQQLGLDPTPVQTPPGSKQTSPTKGNRAAENGWASFENSFETNSFSQPPGAEHTTQTFKPSFGQEPQMEPSTQMRATSANLGFNDSQSPKFETAWTQEQPRQPAITYAEQFFSDSETFGGFGDSQPSKGYQTLPNLRTSSQHSLGSTQGPGSPGKRYKDVSVRMNQTMPAAHRSDTLHNEGSGSLVSPQADALSPASLSETASRKSVFSAFEESLKQPALAADPDITSPLSDGTPKMAEAKAEGKASKNSLPKFPKRTHRRSTSEPAAVENWNLIKDQPHGAGES